MNTFHRVDSSHNPEDEKREYITRIEQTLAGDPNPEELFDIIEDILGSSPLTQGQSRSKIMMLRESDKLELLSNLGEALRLKADQESDNDFKEVYLELVEQVQDTVGIVQDTIAHSVGKSRTLLTENNTFNEEADRYRRR